MRHCLRIAFLSLLASRAVQAQSVELRGRVIDSLSAQPIADVIVRLPELARYTVTNSAGLFRFADVRAGVTSVVITQLGYSERQQTIVVHGDTVYTFLLAPTPIPLDAIVVEHHFMNRMAQIHASRLNMPRFGVMPPPVFWDAWDRDAIVKSGLEEPMAFLKQVSKVAIRKCAGFGMPADRLCVSAPFGGAPPAGWGGWQPRDFNSNAPRPGPSRGATRIVPVYLDDRSIGRIENLSAHRLADIYRIETFGYRGEEEIRLYTLGYMRLVAAGLVDPQQRQRLLPVFELSTTWSDTVPARPRRPLEGYPPTL